MSLPVTASVFPLIEGVNLAITYKIIGERSAEFIINMTSDPSFYLTNDGVRLAYHDQGEGPIILLIPGWRLSSVWWQFQVNALISKFRVITLDMRGCGNSDKPIMEYDLNRYAKDIYGFIHAKNFARVNLVGWSLGASTIFAYIDLFGTKFLSSCTLIDQSPKCLNDAEWNLGLRRGAFTREEMNKSIEKLQNHDADYISNFIPAMFSDKFKEKLSTDDLNWMIADALNMPAEQAFLLVTDHWNQDWRGILNLIDIPALIISGYRSLVFDSRSGEYLARNIKDSKFELFENSGHVPFYEEPERFNRILTEFLI